MTRLNPYLNFNGNTKEVMEFYQSVFGGKLTISTFKELKMASTPADENKVMHSMLETENGVVLMAADIHSDHEYKPGTNISISLSGENDEELTGYFNKLSAGGKVGQPLVPAPWGDKFGMLTDKFGIQWLVNIIGKNH